jgi:Domain of unknown function DUF29
MVTKAMGSNQSLYDRDFYAWANEQAALLRGGRIKQADIPNIAEEIESMGRTEKRELISRLTVLLVHLLKWTFQNQFRSRSWELTVREQRRKLERHLDDNPSLKPLLGELLLVAFEDAVNETEAETGVSEKILPKTCPWTVAQVIERDWFPE